MEIKATLNKPYNEADKLNFIVTNNHQLGYEIKETQTALEAWGYTDEENLLKTKTSKIEEALNKAYDYEQNGTVEYKNCVFEMSLSNRQNLKDTVEALTALSETSTMWNDKDDNLVELTIEDIQHIRLKLILGNIQELWIEKYPAYLKQINKAQTVEEVNSIVINY